MSLMSDVFVSVSFVNASREEQTVSHLGTFCSRQGSVYSPTHKQKRRNNLHFKRKISRSLEIATVSLYHLPGVTIEALVFPL